MPALLRRTAQVGFAVSVGALLLLVWLRVLDVVALAIVEALVLVALLTSGARVWLRYHSVRTEGLDAWQALDEGLALVLPRRVASFVVLEPHLWICLFRWIFRRRSDADSFSYNKGSSVGVFVIAALFSAPIEILVVDLLIPIPWLKLLFLVLSIYSVFWLLGYTAALSVLPHRLAATGLHVNYGIGAHGFIPYAAIAGARLDRRRLDSRDGFRADAQRQTAWITVGGATAVTLELRQPIVVRRMFDSAPPITTLHLAVDEPQRLAQSLERYLAQQQDVQTALAPTTATSGSVERERVVG